MSRKPLPIGEWGLTARTRRSTKTVTRYRAVANFRDFDGQTRRFEAWGKSATRHGRVYSRGCKITSGPAVATSSTR